MARGDTKPASYRGYGGSGSGTGYDDEGRGSSKTYWDQFQHYFELSGYSAQWLLNSNAENMSDGLTNTRLYLYVYNMVSRFNVHDWAWNKYNDPDNNDGRVRRLVIQKCGRSIWQQLQQRAKEVVDNKAEAQRKEREARDAEWSAHQAAFDAKRITAAQEEWSELQQHTQFLAGSVMSEYALATAHQYIHDVDEGVDIDDVVTASTTGYGFTDDNSTVTGIKLQVTVSVDHSNSMMHNRVNVNGQSVPMGTFVQNMFLKLCLAMDALKQEYGDDFFFGAFEFAENAPDGDGKRAQCVSHAKDYSEWNGKDYGMKYKPYVPVDYQKGVEGGNVGWLNYYRPSQKTSSFYGNDTWFYPLFESIAKWEIEHSDPQATRLDIVLTDAVIEHPSDIRRSSQIQAKRNGNLQTIFLNFLPASELVNSDLPYRCTQYVADPDNAQGIVLRLISEFLQSYM